MGSEGEAAEAAAGGADGVKWIFQGGNLEVGR